MYAEPVESKSAEVRYATFVAAPETAAAAPCTNEYWNFADPVAVRVTLSEPDGTVAFPAASLATTLTTDEYVVPTVVPLLITVDAVREAISFPTTNVAMTYFSVAPPSAPSRFTQSYSGMT